MYFCAGFKRELENVFIYQKSDIVEDSVSPEFKYISLLILYVIYIEVTQF